MGKADQTSSLFWLVFGLAVVYGSHRLGLGQLTEPGPGFLLFWSSVILCALAIVVFFQGRKTRGPTGGPSIGQLWVGANWPKPIYVIVALLAYILTFSHLGFLLTTFFLLLFLFKGIEPEKWTGAILGAFLASTISYVLFAVWLQVQLPRGYLENLLF